MSVDRAGIPPKTPGGVSVRRRERAALRGAGAALGLEDERLLAVALLDVAAEEVRRGGEFAARVRAAYATAQAETTRAARPDASARLVPIARVSDAELDPFAPLDPGYLLRLYGAAQLPRALAHYSHATLKEAAARLAATHPGTGPRSRRGKEDLIAYIAARVTGADATPPSPPAGDAAPHPSG
ncbi:MAG: hypothetical protein IVW57_10750 [Ktedonobacterales bacterium]|nr:hypothetical protein [Ktedonobacterales bacterium]